MRSIQVPPDQLELFHGESHEDAILLRMAKKYRRLLYQNRLLFFVKCSIDPEGSDKTRDKSVTNQILEIPFKVT
jgi:hypothetical protein